METSKPIALTIDLGIVRKACPPHLADRLSSKSPPTSPTNKASQVLTPPSSPEKLAVATKLHEAHLQAVKDRAMRDVARIEEARLRRLRAADKQKQKIERTMEAATAKAEERKRDAAARAEEAKQRRKAAAERFMANRAALKSAVEQRGHAEAERCATAEAKRIRSLNASIEKSASEFRRAIVVSATQKENRSTQARLASEKLADRLSAASSRRASHQESRFLESPSPDRIHRVLNDAQVTSGLKKRSLLAAMNKAAENRENVIQDVKEKATAHLESVKAKVEAQAEVRKDAERAKRMHEKLVAADVTRAHQQKMRYGALRPALPTPAADSKADDPRLVLVGFDPLHPLKPPPVALLRRLAASPGALLATATARQLAAATRRKAMMTSRAVKLSTHAVRCAEAATRRARALAARSTAAEGRATRSTGVLARRDAARKSAVAAAAARHTAAAKAREARSAAATAKGAREVDRCAAARQLHALFLQRRARGGISKLQQTAFKSRRAASEEAQATKVAKAVAMGEAAGTRRANLLAKRVAVAKALAALGPLNKPKAAESLARADRPVMVAFAC